jgi:CheY-like chemotaxis protein
MNFLAGGGIHLITFSSASIVLAPVSRLEGKQSHQKSILIVEDDDFLIQGYQDVLGEWKQVTLSVVTNAEDTLSLLGNQKFDLVILDNTFPWSKGRLNRSNGKKLAGEIRAKDQTIPIIFATGDMWMESTEETLVLSKGEVDFWDKLKSTITILLFPPSGGVDTQLEVNTKDEDGYRQEREIARQLGKAPVRVEYRTHHTGWIIRDTIKEVVLSTGITLDVIVASDWILPKDLAELAL